MSRATRRARSRAVTAHARQHFGSTLEEVLPGDPRTADVKWPERVERVWVNRTFIAQLYRVEHRPGWRRLSISRHDQNEVRGWDVLQRIKNETVGPEARALEVFPTADGVVDVANMRHLWIVPLGYPLPDLGKP